MLQKVKGSRGQRQPACLSLTDKPGNLGLRQYKLFFPVCVSVHSFNKGDLCGHSGTQDPFFLPLCPWDSAARRASGTHNCILSTVGWKLHSSLVLLLHWLKVTTQPLVGARRPAGQPLPSSNNCVLHEQSKDI